MVIWRGGEGWLRRWGRSWIFWATASSRTCSSHFSRWRGRALVTSRGSRAAYAILKCVCFCYLGLLVPVGRWHTSWLDADVRYSLLLTGQILAGAAGVFCIARAVPVVWEGRRYLELAEVEGEIAARAAAAIEGIRGSRRWLVQKAWARFLSWMGRYWRRRRWSGGS